jgi:hypothetical protein
MTDTDLPYRGKRSSLFTRQVSLRLESSLFQAMMRLARRKRISLTRACRLALWRGAVAFDVAAPEDGEALD